MTRIFSIVFVLLLVSAANAGLDANEIYKFESCAPYDPNLPKEKWTVPRTMSPDIDKGLIQGNRKFPEWGFPLGPYLTAVQRFNSGTGGSCRPFVEDHGAPHPLTRALAEVTELTVNEIGKTIESQRRDLSRANECLSRIKAVHLNHKEDFGAEHFDTASSQTLTAKQCAAVTNFLLKDLKGRYQRMRYYMALKVGPAKHSEPLEHDQPLTQFIAAIRFPSVATRVRTAPGLLQDELPAFMEFQNATNEKLTKEFEGSRGEQPMRTAADLYDSLISTTPVLLQMPEGVTPRSLKTAMANMYQQQDFDVSEFKKDPRQEIMLYTLYVEKAISLIPQERREVACHAVKKVYENLIFQYEKKPRVLAMLGLALAAPTGGTGALGAVGFKALLGQFAKRAGISASVFSGIQSLQNFQRYQTAIEYCGTIMREKFEDPTGDGLCTLSKTNQILEDAEVGAAAAAAIGGAMWLKGPAVTAYKKVRDAIRETGKASP